MGQVEIYEWLKDRRLSGDERFFSHKEIKAGMDELGQSTLRLRACLIQLESFGYVDTECSGKRNNWFRRFRIKDACIKDSKTKKKN